jgi:hypothetical protein
MKPAEYRHSCTISKQVPYNVIDKGSKGTQPGVGVLEAGRVVWLDHELDTNTSKTTLRAYAEGVGLINIDPGALTAVC